MNIEEFLFCSFLEMCTFILLVFSHVSFQYLLYFLIISSFLSLIEKDSFMGIFSCFFYTLQFLHSPVFDMFSIISRYIRIFTGFLDVDWGTSMLGKKYTAEHKIEKGKEYLSKIENGEMISKADFAYLNGLSDSMFNDWVIKFESSGKDLLMLRNKLQFLPITLLSKSQK